MNNKSKYIQQNTSPKNIQKENSMSNSFISRTSYNTLPNEEDFHKSYFLKLVKKSFINYIYFIKIYLYMDAFKSLPISPFDIRNNR